MKNFLKLIRIQNLLMIALMQIIVKYTFLDFVADSNGYPLSQALNNWQYALLVFSTVLIAAGGYIINDIYDVQVDYINKPDKVYVRNTISEKAAYNAYFAFTIVGVCIGFYLSRVVELHTLASLHIISAMLLFAYSNGLKQIPIVGNVVVGVLGALSIGVIILFNLTPRISSDNYELTMSIISILLSYSIIAFLIHFAREIVKTIEDIEGDGAEGITTCATYFGVKISKIIIVSVLIILIGYVFYYIYINLSQFVWISMYFIAFIVAPLIYVAIKTIQANEKSDYSSISNSLKLIMLFIMLSLPVIMFVGC